jgi:hypothetical protein
MVWLARGANAHLPDSGRAVRGGCLKSVGVSAAMGRQSGTATSGEFTGDTVVETFTAPNIAFVDCGTPGGVAALDFVTAIAITL